MTLQEPNFDRDVARFQALLRESGYPTKIIWLTSEDVLVTGNGFLLVRVPVPTTSETTARQMFEDGVAHRRGLLLSTVCQMEDSTCCYVWWPKDGEEGHLGLWPTDGGVKITVKIESAKTWGKAVRNRSLWQWYRLRHCRKQAQKNLLFN